MRPNLLFGRITRNALANVGGRSWYLLVWFAVTPYVLVQLGDERFGVWSLLFLVSGYLATLDFGLGPAVVRFTARHAAQDDWELLRRVVAHVSRIFLLLGILWVALVVFAADWILASLGLPAEFQAETRFAILLSTAVFAFANLVNVGTGILNGLQRMGLSNGILVAASIPQLLLLLFGLSRGFGLYAVAVSTLAQWVVTGLLTWIALRRVAPAARWPIFRAPKGDSEWIGFGAAMQANTLILLGQQQVDKLFLVAMAGVRTVTQFELGFRVANGLQSVMTLAQAPLLPAFAEAHSRDGMQGLHSLWRRTTEPLVGASVGLATCAPFALPLLVRGWVGPGYVQAEVLSQWMIVAFAINLCTGTSTSAARGAGHADLEIVPGVGALAVHVVASLFLIRAMGPVGAGPAMLLGFTAWTVVFQLRFAFWSGLSLGEFLPMLGRALLWGAPALLAGRAVLWVWPESMLDNRAGLLLGAFAVGAVPSLLFVTGWWSLWRRRQRPPTELVAG